MTLSTLMPNGGSVKNDLSMEYFHGIEKADSRSYTISTGIMNERMTPS